MNLTSFPVSNFDCLQYTKQGEWKAWYISITSLWKRIIVHDKEHKHKKCLHSMQSPESNILDDIEMQSPESNILDDIEMQSPESNILDDIEMQRLKASLKS